MKGLFQSKLCSIQLQNKHPLVNGDDIDLSEDEGITEDDAADTTLGVKMRIGKKPCGKPGTHRN
jgi:hypothetical protein